MRTLQHSLAQQFGPPPGMMGPGPGGPHGPPAGPGGPHMMGPGGPGAPGPHGPPPANMGPPPSQVGINCFETDQLRVLLTYIHVLYLTGKY